VRGSVLVLRFMLIGAAVAIASHYAASGWAMNKASVAAVKAGLDQAWTMRWTWDADGRLVLDRPESSLPVRAYSLRRATASGEEVRRPWEVLGGAKVDEATGRHVEALTSLGREGNSLDLTRIALRQVASGDVSNGRRTAELAYAASPDSPDAGLALGHILNVYGTDQVSALQAIEVFSHVLASRHGDAAAESGLGHALLKAGRQDDALTHLSRAEAARPDDPILHRLKADALLKQGRRDLAVAELRRAIELDPGYEAAIEALNAVTVR